MSNGESRQCKNGSFTVKLRCGHEARISVEPYDGNWQCICTPIYDHKSPTVSQYLTAVRIIDYVWHPDNEGEAPEYYEYDDRPVRAMHIEKTCPKCGHVFTSWKFIKVNGQKIDVCPLCEAPLRIDSLPKRIQADLS